MANHYEILIKWSAPYPKECKRMEKGSNESVATSRALKWWRKEEAPKKRIDRIIVDIRRIGS
jgi:hypothetical protein